MSRALAIRGNLPDNIPEDTLQRAEANGKQAVVLFIQQQGELTIREAAAELGITYEQYLDLLADHRLPASIGEDEESTVMRLRARLP